MSIDEIKSSIASLSPAQQRELTAFLFHLRHISDSEYQDRIHTRLAETEPGRWLTPEEFEKKLDQ